jgi:hypothetical protein
MLKALRSVEDFIFDSVLLERAAAGAQHGYESLWTVMKLRFRRAEGARQPACPTARYPWRVLLIRRADSCDRFSSIVPLDVNAPATPITSARTILGGRRDHIRQESLTTAEADSTTRRPPDSTELSRIATRSVPAR